MESMAKTIALNAHKDQKYGDEPYAVHLYAVVQILRDYDIRRPEMVAAAWLHDAVEDTGVTVEQIEGLCGKEVADMVWACTGVGMNRKARNASIYEKIAACPEAADIKLADRIANVEASQGTSLAQMYAKEREAFDAAVCGYADQRMRERLNRAYENSHQS